MWRPFILILAIGATSILATRSGDEDFGADPSGQFVVFADKAIQIINPGNLTVVKNLTIDQANNPLTTTG
jgi:hypothetical protein